MIEGLQQCDRLILDSLSEGEAQVSGVLGLCPSAALLRHVGNESHTRWPRKLKS